MTKEELEKEAEDKGIKYADSLKVSIKVEDGVEGYAWFQVEQAYERGALDFAEPREKRIVELEKENAELKKKCYKKAVKDYCELEKENVELKNKIRFIGEQIDNLKAIAKYDQLTKAKEPLEKQLRRRTE